VLSTLRAGATNMSLLLANAVLIPLLLAASATVGYVWTDIARRSTRYLPRVLWALVVFLLFPLGILLYLVFGRGRSRPRGEVPWFGRFIVLFPITLFAMIGTLILPLAFGGQHLPSAPPHPLTSAPPSP
jgi:membrane protease YdiL (CAAX protease family)